jgi:prophage antirepressor-like protein
MSQSTGAFAPAVFDFQSHKVRFANDSGEPWFCAADVCTVLGYRNARDAVTKHCKERGVAKRDTPTESGIQPITFINEGNLYRLVIKSRKPEAEAFEQKVMEEILPAIRKTGGYGTPSLQGRRWILEFHKDEREVIRPEPQEPSQRVFDAYIQSVIATTFASQYIFKAQLAEKDWKQTCFVFGLDHPDTHTGWCKSIDDDALMSLLAKRIAANHMKLSNADLSRLAAACCQKLAQQFEN